VASSINWIFKLRFIRGPCWSRVWFEVDG